MSRAARPLFPVVLLCLCGAAACANPGAYGAAWREAHPDFTQGPARAGAGFGETLASLGHSPVEDTNVSVSGLRVLRVTDAAWQPIQPKEAESDPGRIGAGVALRCSRREGWRWKTVERASWYLFRAGQLEAFDHTEFAADCSTRRSFRPSPPEEIDTERTLVRWVAQRQPGARLSIDDRLRQGRALVEVGRLDEARAALRAGGRVIDDMTRERQRLPMESQDERLALQEREAELRALHSVLKRAIREAERPPTAPD